MFIIRLRGQEKSLTLRKKWSSTLISNNKKRLCLLTVLFINFQTTTCRRILVPDTSPCLFYKFLGYLYSGVLDIRSLSLDDVTEMLALSDKYEVSLTDMLFADWCWNKNGFK